MLKVMTLNLNYYVTKHGPWLARRALISDLIAASDADVVALQAVRSEPGLEGGLDGATQLSSLLPDYQYTVFQPADTLNGAQQGSAFLSRLEIAETDYLDLTLLPGLEDNNRRVVLHARFDLPDGPFHLYNAHVSWVYDQARDNLAQILPYVGLSAGPALLVGDFNQTPDADLWQPLAAAGWTDLWSALRPGGEGGATFESDRPSLRIDYAWANRDLAPAAQSIEILGQAQETADVRLSDHLALLATFDLETWRE